MSKTVNVAMIGLGFGAEFIPIYQAHPQANVYAVCRRNEAELHKVGDRFEIEKRFTSYEDVLADPDIDFVHINSPIPDHAWMSLRALDAGKHVMCTVPMATTIDECRQIVEKVKETSLKYSLTVRQQALLFCKFWSDLGRKDRGLGQDSPKTERQSGKENQLNPDLEKRVPREILEELIEEGTEAFRGILEKLFNVAMQVERSEFLGERFSGEGLHRE